MRQLLATLALASLALSCATRPIAESAEHASAARALFDGHSLAGWDGDARFWRVEDGALVGQSTPENPCNETTYLVWRGGEVGDFELACEFEIEGGNSGVQFRSREVGPHQVAGYQADIEDGPNWTGCVYEQDGRGVMAKRGERVVYAPQRQAIALDDAGALLDKVRVHDWNQYVIRAVGSRIELTVNGARTVELVDRDAEHASRRGVLALQLHQGAPMRVKFRNLQLRELASEPEAEMPHATVAAPLVWTGPPPQWLWNRTEASDGEVATFEREFEVPFDVAHATVRFAGDDHVRVFVRDTFVRQSNEWWAPVELDVTRSVSRGTNTVSLIDKNDGSLAAAWLELVVEGAHGERLRLITDASWACAPLANGKTFEDWTPADFDRARASAPHSFGEYGVDPWGSLGPAMGGVPVPASNETSRALDANELELPDGFHADLLYSVPKNEQGSWVAMCEDDRGRLIVSDQYGGLYRVAPPPLGGDAAQTKVEHLPIDLDSAQGLCWAFDSLYVVVSSTGKRESGLYRVRDTNGDGELDDVALLRKFDGGGEHGPHAVVLGPHNKLWIIAGNHTKLPEPIDVYRLPKTWGEDHLLPVIEDPNGHAVGIRAPGGWIVRTDENGERWELWAGGMRNAYDFAFDPDGEPFTYDSDMEWDMGAPWYKAPRFLHLVSGADFGWRSGTANWPVDYPDTLPSVCETGPASPTGVAFGTNAKFPEKYRGALFGLDWAYGTIYAVHLEPKGSSFTGQPEKFATGKPFPVTDVVIARDGAMYVTTGGRKTQSGLYRITWTGDASAAGEQPRVARDPDVPKLVGNRKWCEERHGVDASQLDGFVASEAASDMCIYATSRDAFVRHAGFVALEEFGPATWFSWNVHPLPQSVCMCIAPLHVDPQSQRDDLLARILAANPWNFERSEIVDYLRLIELVVIRCQPLNESITAALREKVASMYPWSNERVNRELAMLLVALESPKVIEPLLATMEGDASQEEKIHALYCLRAMKAGWTLPLRHRFFVATDALRAVAKGGHSLNKYLDVMRQQVVDSLDEVERRALSDFIEVPKSSESSATPAAVSFVKRWTKDDLLAELREPLHARSFEHGKTAFAKASCAQCHRIGGEGGATGPDLTGAASRFSASDLVEAIVEPSKAISDQYQDAEVRTKDGELYVGRIEGEHDGKLTFRRLPPQEDVIELDIAEIESRRLTPLSRMPSGLLDVLTRDEVLDLFAYVLAGGDAANAAFR